MKEERPQLLLFSAVPAASGSDGRLRLDDKFVSGMRMHAKYWDGRTVAVMRHQPGAALPFSSDYTPDELGFEVRLVGADEPLENAIEPGLGLVLASADMADQLHLWRAARREAMTVVYGIEYSLNTRLRIAALDRARTWPRRIWSMGWNLRQERARRAALREADAIQINGFPAAREYRDLNRDRLRYLDNRMLQSMFANSRDMSRRREYHRDGGPLRLIHSGRLEPMKGAHLLIPLAQQLTEIGVDFTLDIYGDGCAADGIRQQIAQKQLSDHVRLHDPVPFETGLVPISRTQADVFVSCHVQSDPSCTYIEAMGCGLPVVGFDNQMLSPLVRDSNGGWTVPMNRVPRLAEKIATLAGNRDLVIERAEMALVYARRHDLDAEFGARMEHLARVFEKTRPVTPISAAMRGRRVRARS